MKRRVTYVGVLVGLGLLASGCGGGGATETPTPAAGAEGATASSTATSAAPGTAPATATDPTTGLPATGTSTGGSSPSSLPATEAEDVDLLSLPSNANYIFKPKTTFETSLEADPYDTVGSAATAEVKPPPPPPAPAVTYTGATISLNGQTYTVQKGSVFPKSEQIFQVKSISANSVVIQLVAGEFSNGSDGITLEKGEKVPLVNQDEGVTYNLRLLSVESSVASTSPAGTYSGYVPQGI